MECRDGRGVTREGTRGVDQARGGGPLVFTGAIHYNESHGGR